MTGRLHITDRMIHAGWMAMRDAASKDGYIIPAESGSDYQHLRGVVRDILQAAADTLQKPNPPKETT